MAAPPVQSLVLHQVSLQLFQFRKLVNLSPAVCRWLGDQRDFHSTEFDAFVLISIGDRRHCVVSPNIDREKPSSLPIQWMSGVAASIGLEESRDQVAVPGRAQMQRGLRAPPLEVCEE